MKNTKIEWCNHTWNPWIGCQKVSTGCKYCYMFRDQRRYGNEPDIVRKTSPKTFTSPAWWYVAHKKTNSKDRPRIFTCSWSDFFIEEADDWRSEAIEIIEATPDFDYLILTKRIERVALVMPTIPKNVWLGISAENQDEYNKRVPLLLETNAKIKFISAEPLLEHISTLAYLNYIDWVITGGESGPRARKAEMDWFLHIKRQCASVNVPFFHKQHGGNKKIDGAWGGRKLNGKIYSEFPK